MFCPGTTLVACAVGGFNCVCVDKEESCVEGMLYRMLCLNSLPGPLGECNEVLVEQPAVVEDSRMCGLRGVARPVGKKRCMYIDMGLFALRATSSVNSREYPAIAFAS